MVHRDQCVLCHKGVYSDAVEIVSVHSNVRHWIEHRSTVWRCPVCRSIHSREVVDLSQFYERYPFSNRALDSWTRAVFRRYVGRLRRHGLRNDSRLLDYGCSEGLLLTYCNEQGIVDSYGYDPYISRYDRPELLERQYDFVVAQDVIEHVEDPEELFHRFTSLVRKEGVLCLGTPRAESIDLRQVEEHIHSLHQPFHIHILSEEALLDLASRNGFHLEAVYRKHIVDTPRPFVNWRFLQAYMKKADNTLDAGFDDPDIVRVLKSPSLMFNGLFGYLLSRNSELTLILRKVQS